MATRSVEVNMPPVGGGDGRTLRWRRAAKLGLVLGLAALLVGDRGAFTASTVQGIDPLDILNLQVKPNVLFVVDSAASMGFTPDHTHYVGGDDLRGQFYQTKQAIRELVRGNDGRANFGMIDLSANLSEVGLNYNGPLVYVSAEAAASIWSNKNLPGGPVYFDKISTTQSQYDFSLCGGGPNPLCSQAVFRSFGTELTPPGITNPPGTIGFDTPFQGFHFIQSRLFRNNVRFTFDATLPSGLREDSLTAITPITCTPPPAGILGDDTDPANDGTETRPCFELEDSSSGDIVRYYYSSGTFHETSTPAPGVVVPVPACNAASNLTALNSALQLEMPIDPADADGAPLLLNKSSVDFTVTPDSQPNTAGGGMRLGRPRRLGDALQIAQDHFNNVVFPARPGAVVGLQKNYVILIAGGDSDTGANPVTFAASMFAQAGGDQIETLVVSFTGNQSPPFNPVNLNAVQSAGSGGTRPIVFGAGTADMLKASLNYAFSLTIASTAATGPFSTESSITESIFEYAARAGAFDPSDPATRYGGRVPIILQSSFDMPGFNGHLRAFVNQGGASLQLWDAGQKLLNRVWNGLSGDGMCPGAATFAACNVPANYHTFAALRGSEPTAPLFKPAGGAKIQRRIFTSQGNGVFPYSDFSDASFTPSSRQQPVPVWPPTATGANAVAPTAPTDPAGFLDVPLGIANLSLLELQSQFLACLSGSTPPFPPAPVHPCQDPNPAIVLARARREAREMILAYTAGAAVAQDANGLPSRDLTTGDILYRAKDWMLPESTLAVPAVVPPPLEARPLAHTAEYNLYRDGVRDSSGNVSGPSTEAQGFGLRNPDKNTSPPLGSDYKPIMSVVYHATNDMLHAFRAGPCPAGPCTETGGEELWGFVPYDQLGKLRERMQGQGRVPHTYVLGTSVRFTDVFVPDANGFTIGGRLFDGRWRTVLLIGRGIAGKHYTSLDITTPERFNRSSLDAYPAFPIWSRGNPDTQDGTPTGLANSLTDPSGDEGADDVAAYSTMGETWSVPAVVAVKADVNFDKEYVAFAGSGFNDDPTASPARGKTFYVIDAVTGDVLHSNPLPSTIPNTTTDGDTTGACEAPLLAGEVCPVPNALVANPSAYVASQLAPGFVGNPSSSTASLVYMGDLHGRMWKYIVSSPSLGMIRMWDSGPDQPIAASVALLNLGSLPHVYYETGNDRRVLVPPNFRMYALQDNTADKLNTRCDVMEDTAGTLVNCGGTDKLFRFDFENAFAGYRGTAQPSSAFNDQKLGRVFFIGTKLNDQDQPGGNCVSNFDSVFFAVGAQTGGAVYDLDASGSIGANEREIKVGGTKINAVRGAMGQIVLDRGELGVTAPAPPPAPAPAPNTSLGSSGVVIVDKQKIGSAICR